MTPKGVWGDILGSWDFKISKFLGAITPPQLSPPPSGLEFGRKSTRGDYFKNPTRGILFLCALLFFFWPDFGIGGTQSAESNPEGGGGIILGGFLGGGIIWREGFPKNIGHETVCHTSKMMVVISKNSYFLILIFRCKNWIVEKKFDCSEIHFLNSFGLQEKKIPKKIKPKNCQKWHFDRLGGDSKASVAGKDFPPATTAREPPGVKDHTSQIWTNWSSLPPGGGTRWIFWFATDPRLWLDTPRNPLNIRGSVEHIGLCGSRPQTGIVLFKAP